MKKIFILVLISVILNGCEKDKEFAYDINLLLNTKWGFPQIEEGTINYVEQAPTVFHEDGRVTFGGGSSYDFWEIRDSRSLILHERKHIWQILELNEDKLHVEKLRYPNGEFLVRCIYYPIEEE